jgi:hypothetical protein
MKIPFFRAGANGDSSVGAAGGEAKPLGLISGLLLLDSGEVERTFVYRCQERYLIYNSLCGLRSLFFVANREHLQKYQEEIAVRAALLKKIENVSQVPFGELPGPLFIPCDADSLTIEDGEWFPRELSSLDGVRESVERSEVFLNQISPSTLWLLSQSEKALRGRGFEVDFELEKLREPGETALRLHDKAACVRLISESPLDLPAHVPTAVIEPEEFLALKNWNELVRLYVGRTGDAEPESFFIKSSFDSAGNAAIRLNARNFEEKKNAYDDEIRRSITLDAIDERRQVEELRTDIDIAPSLTVLHFADDKLIEYKRLQWQKRKGISLLVQREISAAPEVVFDSFGILCFIKDRDEYEFLQASAQLYADADRHHFIGSYISDAFNREFLDSPMRQKLRNLCGIFAALGFRGPIGFDSRLNERGEHVFIYDVNPRLTAVYPPLAVRSFLREKGFSAASVMSLGYRGEFVYEDLSETLSHFSRNNLLYTPDSGKGLILLPNLCRRNGFDITLVNLSRDEIADLVTSGILLETADAGSPAHRRFY